MISLYRCETCNQTILGKCPATKICANSINDTNAIYKITAIIGCASHSDLNKSKKAHDVEKFYKEERIPKYKDTIFEETEDGGAVIGYLTESPSGCPRPTMLRLTKHQYTIYKQSGANYGD